MSNKSSTIIIAIVTIFLVFAIVASAKDEQVFNTKIEKTSNSSIENIVEYQQEMEQFINHIKGIPFSGSGFPIYANPATNSWTYTNIAGWTAGYYPSLLWWVYEKTGNSADLAKATDVTNRYAKLDNVNTNTHDQYVATMPYIKGLKHVNNPTWKSKAFAHVNRLVNVQFNNVIGAVTTTTTSGDVISDSMVAGAVPLLIWAYKNSPSASDKANYLSKLKSHVNVVTRDHFKSDNSGAVWQSVHYKSDGTVAYKHNHQTEGSGQSLTWARGQAWFMYGTSELYEFALYLNDQSLKDKYIQSYNKATNFWTNSLGTYGDNGIMKNTIGMTTGKYDTSGTAIATSSLFKMYKITGKSSYLDTATRSFTRMTSSQYFSNGQLLHGFYSPQVAQDSELIWGDYYLSEIFDKGVQSTSITVTSPNGGENWLRGTTHTLKWTKTGNPGANVKIELLKSGTVVGVYSLNTPNDGSYDWTISPTRAIGTDYKVRVTSTDNPAYTDTSDGNFIISSTGSSSITVTSPNGGENWLRGTTHTLKWTKTGNPGANVKIELLKSGTVVGTEPSTPNDGSYDWKISTTRTIGADYKIRVTSTDNPAYTDTSNGNFKIY